MAANLLTYSRRKWRAQGYAPPEGFIAAAETIMRGGGRVRRKDLFGFADLVLVKPGSIVFLQVTSWSNVSARANKIARETEGSGKWAVPMADIAKSLLSVAGVRIVVEGWKQDDNLRWIDREIEITPTEIDRRRI
jgi:hypothetical protein